AKMPDWLELDWLFSSDGGTLNMVLRVTVACVLLFMLLRILGMAWYLLRFYDYKLQRSGNDLRISCGMFTKVSATVPRNRVQYICVHRPFLLRYFGYASLRIETAGGAADGNENASATVSKKWFLPVVEESEVDRLLDELRPGINWSKLAGETEWFGVSDRTAKRLTRLSVVLSLLATVVGIAVTRPWGWVAGPVLLPVFLWLAYKKSRAKKYTRTEWGVVYQSGFFNRKMGFAFFDRIQGLEVVQTPLDRRWEMAQLHVDTAAAGPAEHTIHLVYLDQDFAFQQFEALQSETALHRPSWS
ncbi:MAG: PH domain-containing protein, partial [Planctomycetota bacterium]